MTSLMPRLALALVGLAAPVLLSGPTSAAPADDAAPTGVRALEPAQRYLTIKFSKKAVRKGKKVAFSGALVAPDAPACSGGVEVTLERSTKGAVYHALDQVTTDGSGNYKFKTVVNKKARYQVAVPATDACIAAKSASLSIVLAG
ncbi:hypothetical protein G5V58_21415 [Nocardioides anomalus]|uniref:Carboxypeptidase regulatory-like domain-containing protein n=1 Tax=Nocardioides anomalus TaxID=2712223 RepID=A0A6G6WIK0_9ACTN|nr:hypothetical protein [Nocardioides anomalus]QIG44987.1 hypothetical protein G5V58_21415 [Nocardioides anomalus]